MKAAIEKLNQPTRSNKANKQSQALKNILEKQELTLKTNEGNQSVSLADIQEDLIDDTRQSLNPISHTKVVSFNNKRSDQAACDK